MYTLPDGIEARDVDTARLRMHCLVSGPADGTPVVLVHGNLSTGLFFDEVMAGAPAGMRVVAPDMRCFGGTQRLPIDATRGLRDWADDTAALVAALELVGRVHLVGWSTGGGAIMQYALDRPDQVASLTLLDPVSPFGFGGTTDVDGTPASPDFAGSGGGLANPEFVERLRVGDRGDDSDVSPRNVMRAFYWHPSFSVAPEREDAFVDEILKTAIGDDGYPGDSEPSDRWPGLAPGGRGILNALSGRWHDVSGIVDLTPKPPVLWMHGDTDLVISDRSLFDAAVLGELGALPGWPGADELPAQPMTAQIGAVLERYAAAGGQVETDLVADAGHAPFIDHAGTCIERMWRFIAAHS